MSKIYLQLREEARNIIATLPLPKFYQQFDREITYSRQMLHSHPLLIKIKKEINPLIEDDFGHGMQHSDLVCVDAGALIQIEMQGKVPSEIEGKSSVEMQKQPETTVILSRDISDNILLVQVAGLLHDIKRKEKKHSIKGANFARAFLSTGGYPLTTNEIDIICSAIKEHEAFQKVKTDQKESGDNIKKNSNHDLQTTPSLISNALYDADKFRWGPDNFTHTLWDMVIFSNAPLNDFIKRYPDGMAILEQIKGTFRTDTGKMYGPDFIDIGIEAGNRLFKII
ncbi:MAG: HD domain-containing protein, partial [Desulfamplus sp.]|nr:HD domain-containing protein [Desulfamplus sp.]